MEDIETRKATEADYDFLYDLHRQAFRSHVEQTWGWDEDRQAEGFRQELALSPFEIIRYRGEDVGCVSMEDHGDSLFLNYMALLPVYQRKGIGTRLVRALMKEGVRRGLPVRLNVLKVNPARTLYEHLGFQITGSDEHRYFMEARE